MVVHLAIARIRRGASLEAADLYCHDERFEATYTHLILLQG